MNKSSIDRLDKREPSRALNATKISTIITTLSIGTNNGKHNVCSQSNRVIQDDTMHIKNR